MTFLKDTLQNQKVQAYTGKTFRTTLWGKELN